MKAKIDFLRKFVQDHKVAIAVGMTATAFILQMLHNQKNLNSFLKEHDLFDQYYSIEK